MAERGARVLGIDYSVKAIQIAKRESKKDNPCYKVCSIFQLNEQNAFDIVISCGSLTFACRNRKELLESMERLRQALKSNGKLLLLEPVHRGFLHRVLDLDIKEFCGVMVEAGFKIERMTNLHFWPMRLALANMSWPRFITAAGYHSGQWIMKLFGNKIFGDCRAIYALIR
jgi:SAM-dependent methyltransferase